MHAHQHDLVDAFEFAEVVDLLSALADAAEADDVDDWVLAGPGYGGPSNRFGIGSSHPPAESSTGKSRSSSGTRGATDGGIAIQPDAIEMRNQRVSWNRAFHIEWTG